MKRDPNAIYHRLAGSPGSPNYGVLEIAMCGARGPGLKTAVRVDWISCPTCQLMIQRLRAAAKERAAARGLV